MRYYISDLHFYHASMNDNMDKRGFSSVEEMNEYMIKKWNGKVRKQDEVVILGDLSLGTPAQTNELLSRLNGKKYLIKGNHDKYIGDKRFDEGLFKWVRDYEELKDEKRKVILSHYPIFCYNGQYQVDKEGNPKSFMLYGHVHNSYDELLVNKFIAETKRRQREIRNCDHPVSIPCRMINCFCMFSDYTPLTLDEWIEVDRVRREKMPEDF